MKSYLVIGTMLLVIAFCMIGSVSAKIEEHSRSFNSEVYTKEGLPVQVYYLIAWQYDPQPGNCSRSEEYATSFIRVFAGNVVLRDEFAGLTIKEVLQSKDTISKIESNVINRTNAAMDFPDCSPRVTRFMITSIDVPQSVPRLLLSDEPHPPACDCSASKLVADQIIIGFLTIWVIFFALVAILLGIFVLIYYMFIEKGETSEKKQ